MDERLLDIVVYMFTRLRDNVALSSHYQTLADDLHTMGFSEREITSAYSWMFDRYGGKIENIPGTIESTTGATRVLAPRERDAISTEASAYLFRLLALGVLKRSDFEELVEACVQSERSEVTLDEMKVIVSGALFGSENHSAGAQSDLLSPIDETWMIN